MLIAYHNDPALKESTVATMREHREAESPDSLFLAALAAGVVSVDVEGGRIFGSRWATRRSRGCMNAKGYVVFTLHFAGVRKQIKAHRAIWLAAHGSIPVDLIPDHVNRNRADNRLANLRLVTARGNALNRRSYKGEANPAARLTPAAAAEIKKLTNTSRGQRRRIAAQFFVSESLVNKIARGALWV